MSNFGDCGCAGFGSPFPFGPFPPGCNSVVPPCNPPLQPTESVPSQLNNLEQSLFGTFTVTPIPGQGGRAVWSGQCSANSIVPGYAMNPGEGFICYIIRIMTVILGQVNAAITAANAATAAANAAAAAFGHVTNISFPLAYSVAQLQSVPTVGIIPLGAIVKVMSAINSGQLNEYQLQAGALPSNPPSYFPPNDNPNAHWMLVS